MSHLIFSCKWDKCIYYSFSKLILFPENFFDANYVYRLYLFLVLQNKRNLYNKKKKIVTTGCK